MTGTTAAYMSTRVLEAIEDARAIDRHAGHDVESFIWTIISVLYMRALRDVARGARNFSSLHYCLEKEFRALFGATSIGELLDIRSKVFTASGLGSNVPRWKRQVLDTAIPTVNLVFYIREHVKFGPLEGFLVAIWRYLKILQPPEKTEKPAPADDLFQSMMLQKRQTELQQGRWRPKHDYMFGAGSEGVPAASTPVDEREDVDHYSMLRWALEALVQCCRAECQLLP
ncbi:hypothetical protein C8Q76DRAFT_123566 [Earliella scabrosa]|nr:hypothetical protein C8Q76DRAFT_123566 [Earliella scabrosa]